MTHDASALTLPEELLLLTLDPERGKPLCDRTHLRYGTAGAVLAELELQGRIREERGRVQVVNPLDPAHPLLASLLATLDPPSGKKKRFRPGTSAKAWIRLYGRNAEERHLDHLIERGLLRRETRRFLGVFRYQRHFPGDPDLTGATRWRFGQAEARGFPDQRSRALAGLALGDGPGRHPHHGRPRGPLGDEDRTPRPLVRLGGPPQRPPEPVQRRKQRQRRLERRGRGWRLRRGRGLTDEPARVGGTLLAVGTGANVVGGYPGESSTHPDAEIPSRHSASMCRSPTGKDPVTSDAAGRQTPDHRRRGTGGDSRLSVASQQISELVREETRLAPSALRRAPGAQRLEDRDGGPSAGRGLAAPASAGRGRRRPGRGLLRLLAEQHFALPAEHRRALLGQDQRAVLPLDRQQALGQQLADHAARLRLGQLLADAEDGGLHDRTGSPWRSRRSRRR
ncbi:hypothetical protein SBADM41S_04360 [Streptomyces badius]